MNEVIRKYKLDNIKRKLLIHPKFNLVIKKNTRNTLQEMQKVTNFTEKDVSKAISMLLRNKVGEKKFSILGCNILKKHCHEYEFTEEFCKNFLYNIYRS